MRMLVAAAMSAGAAALLSAFGAPAPAHAEMFAAKSNWGCLANAGGQAVLRPCNPGATNSQIPYIANENVFYGALRQNGQCLDVQGGRVVFATCNNSPGQTWKLSGNGQLNNSNGCLVGQGNNLSYQANPNCRTPGTWQTITRVYTVPATSGLAVGTPLRGTPQGLINRNTNQLVVPAAQLVAAGAGNLIGQDGGTLVAAGGGNLVAAGGGN